MCADCPSFTVERSLHNIHCTTFTETQIYEMVPLDLVIPFVGLKDDAILS
jgi:hypothetical protein